MKSRAVLDFIGLPAHVPGKLECRVRKVHLRADGGVIDDGTRSTELQSNCHRFVLEPGDDIDGRIGIQAPTLGTYGLPNARLMKQVAEHEWREDVLYDRRAALRTNEPKLQLVVRALGFDVVGAGELAIGLGKAIIADGTARVTQKSSLLLLPGDPMDLVADVLLQHAIDLDFAPPLESDFQLIRHVAAAWWTDERIARRDNAWLDWERSAPVSMAQGRSIEFAKRLGALGDWRQAPTNPQPTELARLN